MASQLFKFVEKFILDTFFAKINPIRENWINT